MRVRPPAVRPLPVLVAAAALAVGGTALVPANAGKQAGLLSSSSYIVTLAPGTGHPGATPAQVASALVTAATPGVVKSPGSGSVNRLLFTSE